MNILFHLSDLQTSILPIFHKFSNYFYADLPITDARGLLIHGVQEIPIAFGRLHLLQKKFHALHGVHRLEHLSQEPDAIDVVLVEKQFLFSSTGALNIDRRKDPSIHQTPIEIDLHISCSFKLFEDHLIHTASRIHQGGTDDGEASALLDIPGCAEKALWPLKGIGIDSSGEDLPAGRDNRIVGPGQSG